MAPRKQSDPIAAQWQFLNKTDVGPGIFVVKEVKLGRVISVLHITLYQGNLLQESPWISETSSARVVGYFTNGSLEREQGVTLSTQFEPTPKVMSPDLQKLSNDEDSNWERMHMIFMDFVPIHQHFEWYRPQAGHPSPSTLDVWIRQANGEAFTTTTLGYVADASPAFLMEMFRPEDPEAVVPEGGFRFDKIFWYPTVTMSLEVKKALPPGGEEWLRLRALAKVIKNGRYDAEVIIYDKEGDIVALSNHVALAVDGTRNWGREQKL